MLLIYGEARVTFPSPPTKKSDGIHWNRRDTYLGSALSIAGGDKIVAVSEPGALPIVRPKTIGYKDGWTMLWTKPLEPGCQSLSESGTASSGATAANSLSRKEIGMSLSDLQTRSAGPTWNRT